MEEMVSKSSKLYSVLNHRCPRCHEGEVFVSKKAFRPKFDEMNTNCSHCGLKFERETGFFYGSMYVAYGLSISLSLAVFVLIYTFVDIPLWLYLVINSVILLVMVPINFRLARILWLNFFVKYEPHKKGNEKF